MRRMSVPLSKLVFFFVLDNRKWFSKTLTKQALRVCLVVFLFEVFLIKVFFLEVFREESPIKSF